MPEKGDKQACTYQGCAAQMVLKECRMAGSSLPQEVTAGAPFPASDRLEVWFCQMNPRRHVEVRTWGTRPIKDCSVAGCKGVMVHSLKGRIKVPEDPQKVPGQRYPMLKFEAGWVCMENESHFEPAAGP